MCRRRAMMCSPQQVRPATEDIDKEIPIGAKAALKDLRARSMRQFQDVFELGAGEVVLEDLMDEDERGGYDPSEAEEPTSV